MTEEQQAAYIIAQSMVLFATISGMNAENMQRESLGQSMAYTAKDYEEAVNQSGVHNNAVIATFRS